jgi:hypothetical protein
VLPVYLSTAKPLVLRTGEDLRSLWAGAGGRDAWFAMTPKEKAEHIQGLGYDSVLAHRYGQSVVYHATHIKLAIANNEDLAANLVRDLLPDSA